MTSGPATAGPDLPKMTKSPGKMKLVTGTMRRTGGRKGGPARRGGAGTGETAPAAGNMMRTGTVSGNAAGGAGIEVVMMMNSRTGGDLVPPGTGTMITSPAAGMTRRSPGAPEVGGSGEGGDRIN